MTSDAHRGGPTTVAIPWPLKRARATILRHPQLGEYVAGSDVVGWWASGEPIEHAGTGTWSHCRETRDGARLWVRGRSLHPTDAQMRLWDEIDRRLPELAEAAIAAIDAPPISPLPRAFARSDLALREVRMEAKGDVELIFDTPLGDDLDAWPYVTFRDWVVHGSCWAP